MAHVSYTLSRKYCPPVAGAGGVGGVRGRWAGRDQAHPQHAEVWPHPQQEPRRSRGPGRGSRLSGRPL